MIEKIFEIMPLINELIAILVVLVDLLIMYDNCLGAIVHSVCPRRVL